MKHVYHAYFTANNGATYHNKPFSYTNKREAIKSIREICRGNLSQGEKGTVTVFMVPNDRADDCNYSIDDIIYMSTVR